MTENNLTVSFMYLMKNYQTRSPINRASGFLICSIFIFILYSCNGRVEYQRLKESELASGIRHDSLFFGLYFGMTEKEFFRVCWDLHKKGVMREGTSGASVYYPIKSFRYPASMDFYPIFYEDQIVAIPATITYNSWAPWNTHLHAENLQKEVLDIMTEWYGPGFIEVKNPSAMGGTAFVKVDGNRQVTIYYHDNTKVKVNIVDLISKKKRESVTETQ